LSFEFFLEFFGFFLISNFGERLFNFDFLEKIANKYGIKSATPSNIFYL